MAAECNPSIATVCEHEPKSAKFMLSCTGRVVVERKMCNGATDVSMADGREMSDSEWQEYCQTVIPARWRDERGQPAYIE